MNKLILVFLLAVVLLSGCAFDGGSSCPHDFVVVEEDGMLRCYQLIEHSDSFQCGLFDTNLGCARVEYNPRSCPDACINAYKTAEKEASQK